MVGRVAGPRAVDLHGYEAALAVERSLVGSDAPGDVVRIAWEELARGAAPRLAEGQRVALALEPLPTQSLWRKRFPEGRVRVIAARGAGVAPAPSEDSLGILTRYLALGPPAREHEAGLAALCDLVAGGALPLAAAALERLGRVSELETRLPPAAAEVLLGVAHDPARPPALRTAVLELAGRRRIAALRPAVDAAAAPGHPLEASAREARAALDGGIPESEVAALLARDEPALRALAVRHARGTPSEAAVADLIRSDPAPEVRVAAVRSWSDWHGVTGAGELEPALFDPAPGVRGAAAESLGALGEPVVPRLEELANAREGAAAAGPVGALRHAGPAGRSALLRLAGGHPDERVRRLAALAVGRPLPEH